MNRKIKIFPSLAKFSLRSNFVNDKKAQLTIFIILGILIVVIVGFVIFGTRYTERRRGEAEIKRVRQATFDISPIEIHIEGCIKRVAEDALVLLGKQGGYIFTSQGGTLIDFDPSYEGFFFVKHNDERVTYNIFPPKYRIGNSRPTPPQYPTYYFPYTENPAAHPDPDSIKSFEGRFGISQLPPLMEEEGAHSMHMQVAEYVNNNILGCIDFSIFEMQGFEIQQGNLSADVTITKKIVSVHLSLPLRITKVVTEEVTDMEDFSASVDVRLFELHNFLAGLIEQDISDITFDIDHMGNDINGFTVSIDNDVNDKKDDIIIVKDTVSKIKGMPLEYRFARYNRYPALFYLYKCPANCTFTVGQTINEADLVDASQVLDPDEDMPSFRFEPELSTITSSSGMQQIRVYAKDDVLEDWQENIIINVVE